MNQDKILALTAAEGRRQAQTINLIPSENYSSLVVRQVLSSRLTDKYAEGYPGKRYYQGNQFADQIEQLAIDRAKSLFGVPYVNVQPYSGSPANLAVYLALVQPGDVVMGMDLKAGGHLTHGAKVNFSGQLFKAVNYGVGENGRLDYNRINTLAQKYQPKIIWAGATAYPRLFDWVKFAQIADKCGAWLVADIAHYAGLIAGGVYPSPVPFAHILTTTTHKTLRGPRGAMIMATRKGLAKDPDIGKSIDHWVFPGLQGGLHLNNIASIAVALREAQGKLFKIYARQVVSNAQILTKELMSMGYKLVSGGTDNHLILVDLRNKKLNGKTAAETLEENGIVVNANAIPGDIQTASRPSGIRLGTPAVTTRGMKEKEMKLIAGLINKSLLGEAVADEVIKLTSKFPLP